MATGKEKGAEYKVHTDAELYIRPKTADKKMRLLRPCCKPSIYSEYPVAERPPSFLISWGKEDIIIFLLKV